VRAREAALPQSGPDPRDRGPLEREARASAPGRARARCASPSPCGLDRVYTRRGGGAI